MEYLDKRDYNIDKSAAKSQNNNQEECQYDSQICIR